MGWWIRSLGVKRDAHNDDRVAEERKRQFEVPQRGADDGWWGGAHVASGHALFSYPTRVQVCKMESGTRTWDNWFGTLGLLIPFSGVTWHVLEPGAFHKSSVAMKNPPKTSSNESHLKSTTYEWQWHSVYVLHISIVQTVNPGSFGVSQRKHSDLTARSRRPQWLCATSWLRRSAAWRFLTNCLHWGCKLQWVWSRLPIWWYMSVDEHCSIDTLRISRNVWQVFWCTTGSQWIVP